MTKKKKTKQQLFNEGFMKRMGPPPGHKPGDPLPWGWNYEGHLEHPEHMVWEMPLMTTTIAGGLRRPRWSDPFWEDSDLVKYCFGDLKEEKQTTPPSTPVDHSSDFLPLDLLGETTFNGVRVEHPFRPKDVFDDAASFARDLTKRVTTLFHITKEMIDAYCSRYR